MPSPGQVSCVIRVSPESQGTQGSDPSPTGPSPMSDLETDRDRSDPDLPQSNDHRATEPMPAGHRITGMACRTAGSRSRWPSPMSVRRVSARSRSRTTTTRSRAPSRETIAARPPGIWRYLELLPVETRPERSLAVGSTPLLAADRLAPVLGVDRLWIKDDTRNPSLSFKDRPAAIAAARAVDFGLTALACASTGNLAGARRRRRRPSACPRMSSSRPISSRPRSIMPCPTARRSFRSTARMTTSTGCVSRSPTRRAGASSTSTCGPSTPRVRRRWPTRSPSRSAGAAPTSSWRRSPRARCSHVSRAASRSWPTSV